jgi:hypothetical protein
MRILKKILKVGGILLAVLVLAGGLFLAHTWYFKPVSINLFFARTMLKIMLESPEMLSSMRVLEPIGIRGHNARLDDESIAAGDRFFEQLRDAKPVLLSYDDADLSEADLMSKRIAGFMLDNILDGEKYRFLSFPVNQLFGVQNEIPSFMQSTHHIGDVRDAEDYVRRLRAIGPKFDQVLEGLRKREELGIHPPQFLVTKVLAEMREFISTPAEESILMTALRDKMGEAGLAEGDQRRIALEAKAAIQDEVYPAYERLIAHFEALDEKVEGNYGAWHLPGGDDYYRLALRLFTTTDYEPGYIHDLGLAEVDRIQAEILEILAAEGWDVSGGFTAAINELAENPRFYFSDSDEGREEILARYDALIEEVAGELEPWFKTIPTARVEVRRVPEFRQETAPGAYYQRPSMDGSRGHKGHAEVRHALDHLPRGHSRPPFPTGRPAGAEGAALLPPDGAVPGLLRRLGALRRAAGLGDGHAGRPLRQRGPAAGGTAEGGAPGRRHRHTCDALVPGTVDRVHAGQHRHGRKRRRRRSRALLRPPRTGHGLQGRHDQAAGAARTRPGGTR